MSQKIIGVTVGTPISPAKIKRELRPVQTVNGQTPDEGGNVEIKGWLDLTPDDKADIITEVAKIMELASMGFTIVTADGYVVTDVNGERISARIGG